MRRKSLNIILIISMVLIGLLGFVSCTQEVTMPPETQIEKPLEKKEEKSATYDMDGGEARVSVAMQLPYADGKSLSSNHDITYEHFLLTTRYLSDRRDGSTITGEFVDLKLAANGDGGRDNVDLGWFTQGRWLFSVKAANRDGDVLYIGSWEGYVSAASDNSITISMEENAEDVGKIAFDVMSITVPMPRVVVTYTKVWNGDGEHVLLDTGGDGRGLTMTSNKEGYSFYTTPELILPAGAYWLKVQLWNGDELFSGEVLDTYIVPRKTTTISGVFTITGLANFIRVGVDETLKFTDACDEIEFESGTIVTGFHRLGFEDLVDFPYTNNHSDVQYLIPQIEEASKYFTVSNGVVSGSGYPYRQVGFTYGYVDSPYEISASLFKGTESSRSELNAIYAPSVVNIGAEAFAYTNLTDTYFGNIASIGAKAFYGSTIPEFDNSSFSNTISIGAEAFRKSGIKYMDIPSGARIGANAFTDCKSLYRTSFLVSQVPDYCFKGCSALTQVILGEPTTIGMEAFSGCSSLVDISLPSSVTSISPRAFDGCSSLRNTFNVPAACKTIGENAFRGTSSLAELYINAVCGEVAGAPWGADPSIITWWAYKMFLNSNLPADYVKAEGEEEFPQITEKNGERLKYPIDDPKYRLIAYNDVIGATLDGYSIPIPVIDGYALRGWFTDPVAGAEVSQLTVNTRKENWTAYAHWVRGLITVIFSGGRGGDLDTGTASEIYRMVRYQGYYGRIGEEDEKDDYNKTLPTASIAGRDFIGWYLEPEPMIDETSPDETAQAALVRITDNTQVNTKKSHTLFAHYKDHRYTVVFNANLPTNASTYGTRNGVNVSSSYTVPKPYTVVYNQPFNREWDSSRLSSPSYRGTVRNLPDLNADAYKLDNYWFVGWYLDAACTERVYDATKVGAQASNGAVVNLYAKWIGKEKTVTLLSRYKADPEDDTFVQKTVGSFTARFTAPSSATSAWRSYFNKQVVSGREIEKDIPYVLPVINATTNSAYYIPGYTLGGWFTAFTDTTNSVNGSQVFDGKSFGTTPSEVVVAGAQNLYAQWIPNEYTVSFDPLGGSVDPASKKVTYHSKYGPLPVPVRPGYVFTGWYTEPQRAQGYGYQNSDAYITADSYVRITSNHTLYAGWSQIAVIQQNATSSTPLNMTLTYSPTTNGGYYGTDNNIASQNVLVKTVLAQTTRGVSSSSTWSDEPGVVVPVPSQTVTLSTSSNGYVSTNSEVVTDENGNAVIAVSTTASAIPGTASVTMKTISTGLGVADGIVNVKLTGKVTGITANPASQTIYVRNSFVVTMSLTSSEGNLHASNCGLKISHTGPDTYTQIAPGENPASGWVVPGTELTANQISYKVTLRAGYEPASGTSAAVLTATSTSPSLSTQLTTNCTVTINVPSTVIEVGNGSNVSDFFTNVTNLYNKNATAKAQWLVTGFRDWEGGDPAVASSSTTNLRTPGWTNNTGHKVYLFPVVPVVCSSSGYTVGNMPNNPYLAFPTNATKLGTYQNASPPEGYGDFKSATKIYIAGTNVNVGQRCFSFINQDCEFKIAGSIGSIEWAGFADQSGIYGITSENFSKIKTIAGWAFSNSMNPNYSHAVNLASCTSLGDGAFNCSRITSVTTGITSTYAFYDCDRLSFANVTASVVEAGAFFSCNALSSLTLSNTTVLKPGCFSNCTALTSVTLPSTLTTFSNGPDATMQNGNRYGAFEACTSLSSVNFGSLSRVTLVGTWAFYGCTNLSSAVNFSNCGSLSAIGEGAFYNCYKVTSISLPYSVSTIGNKAFYDNNIGGGLDFSANLKTIGTNAFYNNTRISSIRFRASGINIGSEAFKSCTGISSISFDSGSAITLGSSAFYNCSSLTTVDFLAMGSNFNNCSFGSNVWAGTNLQYVKVTKSCFSSGCVQSGSASDGQWFIVPGYIKTSCGHYAPDWWGQDCYYSLYFKGNDGTTLYSTTCHIHRPWWTDWPGGGHSSHEITMNGYRSSQYTAIQASQGDGTFSFWIYGAASMSDSEWNTYVRDKSRYRWGYNPHGTYLWNGVEGNLVNGAYPGKCNWWVMLY